MERYRSGHNGADSKSVWEQSHVGSNPTRCARQKARILWDAGLFCPLAGADGPVCPGFFVRNFLSRTMSVLSLPAPPSPLHAPDPDDILTLEETTAPPDHPARKETVFVKKRLTAAALTAMLLLSVLPAPAFASGGAQNLLTNPGAEDGLRGWTDPDDVWSDQTPTQI